VSTRLEQDSSSPRHGRRRTWALVGAAFALGLVLGGAGGEDPSPPPRDVAADVRRDEQAAAVALGERRFQEGLRTGIARGRAAVRRGSPGYRRIWRRGYREAERKITARLAAQSQPSGGYVDGHRDGYNEGYDEGYGHADAGRPYDNSDNDSPGSVGDDDAGTLDSSAGAASEPDGDGAACDPNYAGACVPAGVGDVNCPDVPGKDVRVVGEDVHGLDREGDGIACES